MDVIYIDSLFGLNLLIDYCLVLVSARVCGVVLRRWRYALAALIGALYAALMVLPGFGWLANGMMKLALGAAMALIAFGGEAHLVLIGKLLEAQTERKAEHNPWMKPQIERQPRAKLPPSEAEAFRNTYLNNPILTGKDRDSSK